MANTYTRLYVHIVFAVRRRARLIPESHKVDIHKYLTGIIRNHGCKLITVNSVPDHIHILIGLHPAVPLSDLVREIKSETSRLINEHGWVPGRFQWQEGFGAFTCGHGELSRVIRYIENQEAHHRRRSFREEFVAFLDASQIEYDERFLPGW